MFARRHATNECGTAVTAISTGAVATGELRYHPFGRTRYTSGTMPTSQRFTGQREDGTGLVYMNARYYDPAIGQFISPDTIVPDPRKVFAYNRYMYGYGNPLEYSDPSGHCATNSTREHRAANCHDYPALLWHNGITQKGKPLCLFFD